MSIISFLKRYRLGLSLVVLTWLIFFFPIISGQYAYFLDDLKIIYYPIESLYADFQHKGELPLWANEFGFGQPLLSWGQLGFFTPLHLLLRTFFVPPLVLLQISVAAYFLIGSIGMFLFLLRRNIHQAAAALGAVVFAYSGFHIGHLNHVNFYTSTMLLPLLLLALDALIRKQTIARATTLALVAAAIAVSGQPQVILYVYIIAFVIGLAMYVQQFSFKALAWTLYAGILAFLLSSFALLPLQEFIPQTERGHGLPMAERYEFSYPPYATITLLFPYFFGDHASYSGPKGFQELAAYVGVIPILLAGFALPFWRSHKAERAAGIVLVVSGIVLALGKYSGIYTYLVEEHYITTIGVVGRFVFFFDIGILLLASIGLHDILSRKRFCKSERVLMFAYGYASAVIILILPFWVYAQETPEAIARLNILFNIRTLSFWLIALGVITPAAVLFTRQLPPRIRPVRTWIVSTLATATLLVYGWNYNPRVPAHEAYTPSPFVETLKAYKEETGLPARLYAAEHLPVTGNPGAQKALSDYISPRFTVFQPLDITQDTLRCLVIPIQADSPQKTEMIVMIRSGFEGTIWHKQIISSETAFKETNQNICFPEIPKSEQEDLLVSFSSNETTNMKVFVSASKSDQENVYFVRVQTPSSDELARSRKPLSIEYAPEFPRTSDFESALMVRHIQAIADASSARWIGALSLKPYREFVDTFFANDSEAFDGDGVHALTRNKKLVDMTGITHFAQVLAYNQTKDPMLDAGYSLVQEADIGESLIRLYANPNTYPKAYIVQNGEFVAAADEIRFRLRDSLYDPRKLVYISGDKPPRAIPHSPDKLTASATITQYTNTRVDIVTQSNKDAFLVLTDSTSDQWQTFIDDQPALPLQANSIFKAAQIPSGKHVVSFRYVSPAVNRAKSFTIIGLFLVIIGYAYQPFRNRRKLSEKPSALTNKESNSK